MVVLSRRHRLILCFSLILLTLVAGAGASLAEKWSVGSNSVPNSPLGLEVLPGNGQALLTWQETESATGYNVYRAEAGSQHFIWIATVSGTAYLDLDLAKGFYKYRVSSIGEGGESHPGDSVAIAISANQQ